MMTIVLFNIFQLVLGRSNTVSSSPAIDVSKLHRCHNVDSYYILEYLMIRFCAPITLSDSSKGCQTLIYTPTNKLYDSIMKILAEQNDLVYGDDIIGYCGILLIL